MLALTVVIFVICAGLALVVFYQRSINFHRQIRSYEIIQSIQNEKFRIVIFGVGLQITALGLYLTGGIERTVMNWMLIIGLLIVFSAQFRADARYRKAAQE